MTSTFQPRESLFKREILYFYTFIAYVFVEKCTLRHKCRAYAISVCLTMDNTINFTTWSSSLVMDLQYVANGMRDTRHSAAWKVWRLVIRKINMDRITFAGELKIVNLNNVTYFANIHVIKVLKTGIICLLRNGSLFTFRT